VAVSFIAYMPFIGAQFYPKFYTMIPAALLVGFGGGPLWCGKCTYLSVVSEIYSELTNVPAETLVVRFFGVFFMLFQFAQVWGNLISSSGKNPFCCLTGFDISHGGRWLSSPGRHTQTPSSESNRKP
jgi:hypothetical protein